MTAQELIEFGKYMDEQARNSNSGFVARVKAMSLEERFGFMVSAGIYNPDGTLTEAYGGKPKPETQAKEAK